MGVLRVEWVKWGCNEESFQTILSSTQIAEEKMTRVICVANFLPSISMKKMHWRGGHGGGYKTGPPLRKFPKLLTKNIIKTEKGGSYGTYFYNDPLYIMYQYTVQILFHWPPKQKFTHYLLGKHGVPKVGTPCLLWLEIVGSNLLTVKIWNVNCWKVFSQIIVVRKFQSAFFLPKLSFCVYGLI